jgi:hypothetical protein
VWLILLTPLSRVLHGNLKLPQLVKSSQRSMEPESSLPRLEKPAACPYPEPDRSNQFTSHPHPKIILLRSIYMLMICPFIIFVYFCSRLFLDMAVLRIWACMWVSILLCFFSILCCNNMQGGSNITGTNCDVFTHKSSRSYLNHLVIYWCGCVCPVTLLKFVAYGHNIYIILLSADCGKLCTLRIFKLAGFLVYPFPCW